ncbi:hypothetical protein [Anaeromicrobium sediminis]|uniref:Uncharacterized protein n=1 Tax=Anaeromicrobium sediminis TaxID=1478221 RepID=A0A267MLM0_9FIRM|nr:hypothetical protein [Anaeromicrobium sediminis]PAB60491.1 hypothetical protein CCE28_06225 [Anaeromicrobium sediminis]
MIARYILIFFPFITILLSMYLMYFTDMWKRTISRIYYFLNLIWITIFLMNFHEPICSADLLIKYNTWDREIFNVGAVAILLILAIKFMEITFFSTINIKKFSFKGMEMTVDDMKEFKHISRLGKDNHKISANVVKAQNRIICEMEKYIESQEFYPPILYENLVAKYQNLRKDVKIRCFDDNTEGLRKMAQTNKLEIEKLTHIMCTLKEHGVCICKTKCGKKIYGLIDTKFTPDDMIVVIEGSNTINGEHLIVRNIIGILDLHLHIEVERME